MPYYDDQADLTEGEIEYATRWARELVAAHVQREGLPLNGGDASKVSARAIALGMKFAKMSKLVQAGARAKWPDVSDVPEPRGWENHRLGPAPLRDRSAGRGLGAESNDDDASAADEERMADDDT